jgi:hypothetical protein
MPGVTQAEFARMVGVSQVAVHKAVKSGRITRDAEGRIDAEKGLRDWKQERIYGRGTPPLTPQATAAAVHTAPPPPPPAAAPLEPPPKSVRPAPPPREAADADPPEGPTMVRLQKAELGLKLEERKLRIDREKGRLIDKAKAVAMVRRLAQEERDALLNWPVRVAALLAARVGADPHEVQTFLEASLREHLAKRGDPKLRLG